MVGTTGSSPLEDQEHVDEIVVGAGTAGCVVAGLLAQTRSRRVLLIEQGPSGSPPEHVDLFEAQKDRSRTYEVEVLRRVSGPTTGYLRGQGLGGSGAINGLVSLTGAPSNYDRWEREFGCTDWGWKHLAPIFRELHQGCVRGRTSQWGPVDRALAVAARELGASAVVDLTGTDVDGVGPVPLATKHGRRWSSVAYLQAALAAEPSTLRILTNSQVARVLLDQRRTVGVELSDGRMFSASNVTLCAGALATPQLLWSSGITNEAIGENLRDHVGVAIPLTVVDAAVTGCNPTNVAWHTSFRGTPRIQHLALNRSGSSPGSLLQGALLVSPLEASNSLGSIGTGRPSVDFRLLTDERDRVSLHNAMASTLRLLPRLGRAQSVRAAEHDDLLTSLLAGTEADAFDWACGNLAPNLHAAGTCRMGGPNDRGAVVSPTGRVYGYDGLHIADASIFPTLPAANPNLTVIAAAIHLTRRRAR